MAGKFEIYQDKKNHFCFRLKASNGETILASQGYKSKSSCMNGIRSVQKNAGTSARFERKTAKNGKPFFTLKAANHQVIGKSEMYNSGSSCENGIKSVGKSANGAKIEDLTK